MNLVIFLAIYVILSSVAVAGGPVNGRNQSGGNIAAEYEVSINETRPRTLFVRARTLVTNGRLFMSQIGVDHLPEGWATFVSDLQASDEKGDKLNFEKGEGANWRVAQGYNGMVNLTYKVDLRFIYEDWVSGNEQAGAHFDDSIFLVTRPIFISSEYNGNIRVNFKLPSNWKASTPWKPDQDARAFIAENQLDLLSNTVILGNHKEVRLREGTLTFILALPGKMKETSPIIEATLKPVLRAYLRLFRGTPPSIFLMTFFHANAEDGEAYSRSSAFTTSDEVSKASLIIWGNFLAHELFHFWNGQQMRGNERDNRQWFSEGFTEYYANLTLVREGLIGEDLFIKKIEKHLAMYLFFRSAPAFNGVSLVKAGERKGFNRPAVYNGGWTVAFCLDQIIREKTSGRKSLDDFMTTMYRKFGAKPYRYDDIVETAGETAGTDLTEFFAEFVAGTHTMPVKEHLKKYGLNAYFKGYAGEFYIVRDSASPGKASEMYKEWISRKP